MTTSGRLPRSKQIDTKTLSEIAGKKRVFAYAAETGNIVKACRYFGNQAA